MPVQDRQQIQSLLDSMRRAADPDARVAAVRRLFSQLNYEVARTPLRAELASDVKKQLKGSPTVIATGGDGGAFLVIHVQLSVDRLPRATERAIVTSLLKDHPYALFVFSNNDDSRWHLLNVKVARRALSDENRDTKLRRLYRRISIAPEDRLRTAIERVEKLDLALISPELFGISPLAIQEAHDEAFDVEAVTKDFFKQYKAVFEIVEAAITGIRGPDKRRLFAQRLFNRLMFIAFIQKKGWLQFPGMEENEYLEALWRDHQSKQKDDSNFYTDRLAHLFFRGLNNPTSIDMLATNRGRSAPESFLQRRIGDVPYLNGGLFEKSDDDTDDDTNIVIPDKAISAILHELFARFNFTVTESTPLDVEVAVDPEMLGKVFEELVTGRHESGSYYTPKPIVSFMCREALKGYLETKCPKASADAVARFVDEHDASALRDGEAVLDALKTVKCCDPACGSGAYLLGMMHELLDLRQTLFKTNQKLDSPSVYQRKLEIIQTNVYGVDLDPFAINVARLRLWLSLAVDFEGEAPPPLPNLDFKIEAGDSLAAPDPSGGFDPGFQAAMVDEFLDLKRQFLLSHSTEKKELKKKIDKLREKIMSWTGFTPDPGVFHWQVEFAEVFVKGGFDAVLANPPYVRQELIKAQKPRLKEVYGALFSGTADLYVFFYLRGLQLLSPGGMLVYISSNKWFRAGYGEKLRAHLAKTTTVQTILDFHDLPVFEAIAYPMIFTAAKRPPSDAHAVTLAEPPDLEPPYPYVKEVVAKYGHKMPTTALGRDGTWHLATFGAADRLAKMRAAGPKLGERQDIKMYRGILTGLNEIWKDLDGNFYIKGDKRPAGVTKHGVFLIDDEKRYELIAEDRRSRDVIKPVAIGRNLKRWAANIKGLWMITTPIGIDIDQYPAVYNHLKRFKSKLQTRSDQGNHWWELRACKYYEEFNRQNIVWGNMGTAPGFCLSPKGATVLAPAYLLTSSDRYLLGVLNSSSAAYFFSAINIVRGGDFLEFKPMYVEQIPIPAASAADRAAIGALAQKCLDAHGADCEQWEKEIDERVAALYGL